MAEAALGAFLQVLFENIFKKIGSLIGNEVRLLEGITEALEKLESTVRKFQHVLGEAEMKNFKSPETKDWYHRLMRVANEADGVLDEALDCLEPYADRDNRVRLPIIGSISNRVKIHRRNLGEKIRSVTRKFNNLDDERSELNMEQINIKRETVSAFSEIVFGREEEKHKIITTLLRNANSHPFIYAIVGMGGIGKTTLAQLIFNHVKVVKEFDTRIWVWVSQTFDLETLMKKIIDHFEKTQFNSMETMQKRLNELLKGKKFLLVLDDIWNENPDEWNKLKSSLEYGEVGSSVLLTTRGSDVASIARAHDQHEIADLSEDQCWHVFKESAFLEIGELEVIGKQIAKKCGGLPLAAKSLGGSLRLTREVGEWEVVRDSPIWELPQEEGDILSSLKLSLGRLDSHSRNCFTFSCIFPKGHKMSKEELIQLWMANDLIPTHPRLELEDMGTKIFNDLVLKSFFQVFMPYYFNRVTMHDLMHDLCLSFRNDCFSLQDSNVPNNIPPQCRHLSIDSSHPSDILVTLSKSHSSLRTCIIKNHGKEIIFKNLDCLRALGLSNSQMQDLPRSIGKIKDLKYLDLSESRYLTHLPDSISTLTKLQTLKLGGCKELTKLPVGITRLVSLEYLDIRESKVTQLPNGMGQLVKLRELAWFSVGRESGQRITELQRMNQLRGSLKIKGLEHVRDAREAEEAILKNKNKLSSLSLKWGDLQGSNESSDKVEGVLEALQPSQSLNKKLVIRGYGGSVFASWMKLLENLVQIELKDCIKCEHLPPLGQLLLLKFLTIIGMDSLKCIGTEFYGSNDSGSSSERCAIFLSLEVLVLEDMPILEEWQDNQQADSCPCLEQLMLYRCPKLTSLPSLILSFVPWLFIEGCDKSVVLSY